MRTDVICTKDHAAVRHTFQRQVIDFRCIINKVMEFYNLLDLHNKKLCFYNKKFTERSISMTRIYIFFNFKQ